MRIRLHTMDVGRLVTSAKRSSGLPVRGLAAAAHVSGSTITRIQSGAIDPTVQTLEKILDAAGFELRLEAVRRGSPRRAHLADLADAWTAGEGRFRLDWTRWRAFLDQLALHPELTPEAIYLTPPPSGEPIIDALLAAVAEKLADDAGLPRPAWTEQAPALDAPYQPPVARRAGTQDIPEQLAKRGLMIGANSLWRDPKTVGV